MAASRRVQSARSRATPFCVEGGLHLGAVERGALVDLAGHAPGGGEVDEHRLALAAQLGHALARSRAPSRLRWRCAAAAAFAQRRQRPGHGHGHQQQRQGAEAAPRARGPAPANPAPRPRRPAPPAAASSAAAPSMPACCPSTQTSQTTVANIGNASSVLKCAIQAPGRGSSAGQLPARRWPAGRAAAMPRPSAANTASASHGGHA